MLNKVMSNKKFKQNTINPFHAVCCN